VGAGATVIAPLGEPPRPGHVRRQRAEFLLATIEGRSGRTWAAGPAILLVSVALIWSPRIVNSICCGDRGREGYGRRVPGRAISSTALRSAPASTAA
jgi:hypothetical protein